MPNRQKDAEKYYYRAAKAGYLKAYGYLAYFLIEQKKFNQAIAVFKEGIDAGLGELEAHLELFRREHPELSA